MDTNVLNDASSRSFIGIAVVALFILSSIIAIALTVAAAKRKGGSVGPGAPLPLPWPLKKGGAPWYISHVSQNGPQFIAARGSLKVSYQAGKVGGDSGAEFTANPFRKLPADACTLSYSVFFPSSFDWRLGGKLPGLCLGECASGGEWTTKGGSYRVVFQPQGVAAGYAYMALAGGPEKAYAAQGPGVKREAKNADRTGLKLFLKSPMVFRKNRWNTVSMTITLNSPSKADGSASLTVNGVTRQVRDVRWRASDAIKITSVKVASFFGGSSSAAAAPKDAYAQFKDFRFA